MLKVMQRFGKHCSCHLQGECWLGFLGGGPYREQAVGGEWDMTDLTDGRSVNIYQTTRCNFPEYNHLHSIRRRENLKSHEEVCCTEILV
jgi:hypothetical protein